MFFFEGNVTLSVGWAEPDGCCVFSVLLWAQLSLLLFIFLLPASVTCQAPLLHPEPPTPPPLMECRNCSGMLALKGLTCLLLNSLLHINPFVTLSLEQSPPGFSGNTLKSKRAFPIFPPIPQCVILYIHVSSLGYSQRSLFLWGGLLLAKELAEVAVDFCSVVRAGTR